MSELLTIGYTEPNAQERIDAFLAHPNTILVDIRFSARSRWAGHFGKGALEASYKKQYIHVPEFGNVNYRPENRDRGIELAWPDLGLKRIMPLLRSGHSVMLLCACKGYEKCHRKVVYDLVMAEMSKAELRERRRLFMHIMRQPEMKWLREAFKHLKYSQDIDWREIQEIRVEPPCDPFRTPWSMTTDRFVTILLAPDRYDGIEDFMTVQHHDESNPYCECYYCYDATLAKRRAEQEVTR